MIHFTTSSIDTSTRTEQYRDKIELCNSLMNTLLDCHDKGLELEDYETIYKKKIIDCMMLIQNYIVEITIIDSHD